MTIAYSLTPELCKELKKPLGLLVRGSFDETASRLRDILEKEKPPFIISVGDTVSRNLERNRIFPRISIIDNIVMRRSAQPFPHTAEKTIYAKNPQATITDEAIGAIQGSLKVSKRTRIVVDGEEDLLTLIAVAYAPENTLVVYGQPHEGIVVVKATETKKAEIARILETMGKARYHA